MRKLSKADKKIIDKISQIKCTTPNSLSNIVSEIFKTDKCALFVSDLVYLIKVRDYNYDSILSEFVGFISLVNELENEGYIYLIPNLNNKEIIIQYNVSTEIWTDQGSKNSKIGTITTKENNEVQIISGTILYEGKAFSKKYSDTLKHILLSYICPTDKLKKFQKEGYVSDEVSKYKTQLCYTRLALGVSLIALIVSIFYPFWLTKWQTNYNNENAVSTLVDSQYYEYKLRLYEISSSLDSISTYLHTTPRLKSYKTKKGFESK